MIRPLDPPGAEGRLDSVGGGDAGGDNDEGGRTDVDAGAADDRDHDDHVDVGKDGSHRDDDSDDDSDDDTDDDADDDDDDDDDRCVCVSMQENSSSSYRGTLPALLSPLVLGVAPGLPFGRICQH